MAARPPRRPCSHRLCGSRRHRGGGPGVRRPSPSGLQPTFDAVRELDGLSVDSCNGSHQFLVSGLAPNGVAGLALERSDGKIARTIPVIDNTVSFSVGHVNLTLRGVGDAAAERLERSLLLGGSRGSFGGDCSGYAFTEVKPKPGS
jgi:hypothetical protein